MKNWNKSLLREYILKKECIFLGGNTNEKNSNCLDSTWDKSLCN